jgi:chorismate mutase/prephenate dehydratase
MKAEDVNPLQAVRQKIDQIDLQIQELISKRAHCALDVARAKRAMGERSNFYRPEREIEVLNAVRERNEGPLPDEHLLTIFREIMSSCLALQQPLNVAFLGPKGTFTQMAVIKHFGSAVNMFPFPTTDAVFREVESGAAQFAVLPVENSTEGVVTHTLDRLMNSPLNINGEIILRIHQNLLGLGKEIGEIEKIYSHQQGLAQTRAWLNHHLPNAERIAVTSTAEAARLASLNPHAAAIAGEAAAETYGLNILAPRIEDETGNVTRFLVIAQGELEKTGEDKTSVLLANINRPGGLFSLLEPLARLGVDMTRIESRPSRKSAWDYVFFIDLIGHQSDPIVTQALDEISKNSTLFRVLGSYPIGSDL